MIFVPDTWSDTPAPKLSLDDYKDGDILIIKAKYFDGAIRLGRVKRMGTDYWGKPTFETVGENNQLRAGKVQQYWILR